MVKIELQLVHDTFNGPIQPALCRLPHDSLRDLSIALRVENDGINLSSICYSDYGDAMPHGPTRTELFEMLRPPHVQRTISSKLGHIAARHLYDAINAELAREGKQEPIRGILFTSTRPQRPVPGSGRVVAFTRAES